jgi:hypothetical protein
MQGEQLQGRRVDVDDDGFMIDFGRPGDYGHHERTLEQVHNCADQLYWNVCAPDGSSCKLDPSVHVVEEHSDGTISVTPSIVTKNWHGWLKHGVWESV